MELEGSLPFSQNSASCPEADESIRPILFKTIFLDQFNIIHLWSGFLNNLFDFIRNIFHSNKHLASYFQKERGNSSEYLYKFRYCWLLLTKILVKTSYMKFN